MKLKIKVPTSLDEITLGQYQAYAKVLTENGENEFTRQKMIEIFCNIDLKDLLQISFSDVQTISNELNELFNKKPPLSIEIDIDKQRFGFIPNLEQMSYGEFVDLDEYLKDISTWDKAMAVLYRPITSRLKSLYGIETYEGSHKYSDLMKELPYSIAYGAVVFFSTLKNELLTHSMSYLDQITDEELHQLSKRLNFPKDGVGIKQYLRSQMEILMN